MNRIDETFAKLRQIGHKAFIPFVTAGDPDIATSHEIVLALAAAGADIIELGVPFSDPMADGPTIQASSMRSLAAGTTLTHVLSMVADLRQTTDVPIVLFSYLNPLHRYSIDRLAQDAAAAGVDGILVTDIVDDEAQKLSQTFAEHGIHLISLIAPTTSAERIRSIAAAAHGFLYAVARAGVTGVQQASSTDAESLVIHARAITELPIAVGFGISNRAHVTDVWRYADGAVVGSAIVAEIANSKREDAAARVTKLVTELLPPKEINQGRIKPRC
ncbi:MAG: tryptophan synthase subunit alpha [Blastocatellia bacterium]|nr:tryptophan synthase subunit alpha [Blastocatellia bacterium]